MEELKALLGMDLPEEAKALIAKAQAGVSQLEEANKNFAESIKSKDNAIQEITAQRAELKASLAELKAGKGAPKDNSDQIEALHKEWEAKYKALEQEHTEIKSKFTETERLRQFNEAVVPKLNFPEWYTEENKARALRAIQNEVFDGAIYDNGQWGYGEAGKLLFDTNSGKPLTIEGKAKSLINSGAFDIYLSGKQGSGGGTPPGNGGGGHNNVPQTFKEKQEAILLGKI